MSSNRVRLLLTLAGVLGIFGGCALARPAPNQSQNNAKNSNDEYDGWLFKSLTGRKNESASAKQAAAPSDQAAPGGVVQASASAALPDAAGPLVPGPSSSHSAGPPPTIPDELPPPPSGAISIGALRRKEEEKKKGFELSDLSPENVYKNVKKAAGYGPNENIAKAALQEGKTLFDAKSYKEAAAKFATAADRWPDSPLEEDALFLEGESEFFADLYSKAHDTYGGLLKKYSNTRHLDTVVAREFALGRYWEQTYTAKPSWPVTPNVTDNSRPMFDTFGYAVQAYERVRAYDPKGPLADDSLMALGNAYFLRGQWENAAYNYDLLCKEYPNSEHQLKAHLFGLQANMRKYQGSAYDVTPLNTAGKLAKTTLTQFNEKQLGDERERVARALAQIEEEKANRDFIHAKYYAQHKFYGAARFYYQSVIDEFPRTAKAKEAKAELEKIRNEPDEPEGFFAPLYKQKK